MRADEIAKVLGVTRATVYNINMNGKNAAEVRQHIIDNGHSLDALNRLSEVIKSSGYYLEPTNELR